ncbi:MAG: restriction endonuclease [Ferrimicrobium sp.]|uniref:Restriction endonuclease n=1 Tax=Ferrimicrobium acidiphilum TaxID=121039 RepID=A0ABV3Y0Q1_9ACTN
MPTWDQLMVPVLRVLSDGEVRNRREPYDSVARDTNLSDDQRAEVLDSVERRYENRINWAITGLVKANAALRPLRAHHIISESGRALLDAHPDQLTEADLRLIERYDDGRKKNSLDVGPSHAPDQLDPYEFAGQGIKRFNGEIASNLPVRLHYQEPAFFEQAVVDLVAAMGHGDADTRATTTQLSNDGGIDGIINQEVLGLSRVYNQAKRYSLDGSVGRPKVQSFVGALQGQQANQGVFITTGRFSAGAKEYAKSLPTRVVLIDGPRLTELMIRCRVGVQAKRTIQIVNVDEDVFE